MNKILCFISLVFSTSLLSIDIDLYYNHSSVQWTWAVLALDELEIKGDEQILDIGSGDGKITALIASKVNKGFVTGLEPNLKSLEFSQQHFSLPNLLFTYGKAEEMSLSNAFDVITAFCSLNWVENLPTVIHNIAEALHTEGEVLIVVPASISPSIKERYASFFSDSRWEPYRELFRHKRSYSLDEYERMLEEAFLEPLVLKHVKTAAVFHHSKELHRWLLAVRPELRQIPRQLLREYFNFHESVLSEIFPQAGDGRIYAFPEMLVIRAKKKIS